MSLFVTTKDIDQLKNGYYQFVQGLDTILDEDKKLNDPSALIDGKHILMYSWNINQRSVNYFTNFEGQGYNNEIKMMDAVLASSANPNFFNPALIDGNFFISGDMILNSPSFYSYELATYLGKQNVKIVSLGTTK